MSNQIIYCIVPVSDLNDRSAAGYDGNKFESREEAEADIPNLAEVLGTEEDHWTVRAFDGNRMLRDDPVAYTLRDFADAIPGGIVRTDRGNGSAGPVVLGVADDIEDAALNESVTLVTEEEDPDAWYLAREAAAHACDGTGRPVTVSLVAVGKRAEGHNGYQAIFVG